MKCICLVSLLLASLALGQWEENPHPVPIWDCIEKESVKGKIVVTRDENPYYLRGDLDGDTEPDYAVAIKGKETGRNGVLICTARGEATILGADNAIDPPFSDMPDDNFVAPQWDVFTRQKTVSYLKSNRRDLPRSALPRGEAIAMIWEDGVGLIYLDHCTYRWVGHLQ